jgi:hypothetical protein
MRNFKREKTFIEKAKIKHGNNFDYSLVEYVNAKTKVKIICKEHGVFEQEADAHVRGHGCKRCKGGVKITKEEFIEKAMKIHRDKFDYSLVEYKNNSFKIKIICKEHGIFEQTSNDHLSGYGCWKCGVVKRANTKSLNKEKFILKANNVHENKYDYSKVIYINSKTKVEIICKKHGFFLQRVNSHLGGSGCPSCTESKGEERINKFLEKNKITFERQKRFKECKNIRTLPFDFYLPNYNVCLEFDGRQHYVSGGFHKDEKSFNLVMQNDKIKSDYCSGKNGKPKLIRISHKEYNKIEEILISNLFQ